MKYLNLLQRSLPYWHNAELRWYELRSTWKKLSTCTFVYDQAFRGSSPNIYWVESYSAIQKFGKKMKTFSFPILILSTFYFLCKTIWIKYIQDIVFTSRDICANTPLALQAVSFLGDDEVISYHKNVFADFTKSRIILQGTIYVKADYVPCLFKMVEKCNDRMYEHIWRYLRKPAI